MTNTEFETLVLKELKGIHGRFDGLEWKFDGLEWRFDGLEWRFDGLETTVNTLTDSHNELKNKVNRIDANMIGLNYKVDTLTLRTEWIERSMNNVLERQWDLEDAIQLNTQYLQQAFGNINTINMQTFQK